MATGARKKVKLNTSSATRLFVTAIFTLIAGIAGIASGISGVVIFRYSPSTFAGSVLAVTSVLTCVASVMVLANKDSESTKIRAAVICVVIQIAASISLLLITTGTSYDFCATSKPCFVRANVTDDIKCDEDMDGKACIEDLSYLCRKISVGDDTDLGMKNCDVRQSKRCNGGDSFWGFDDRDDCLEFYADKNRLFPATSRGLIISGGVLQCVFAVLLLVALESTNF